MMLLSGKKTSLKPEQTSSARLSNTKTQNNPHFLNEPSVHQSVQNLDEDSPTPKKPIHKKKKVSRMIERFRGVIELDPNTEPIFVKKDNYSSMNNSIGDPTELRDGTPVKKSRDFNTSPLKLKVNKLLI